MKSSTGLPSPPPSVTSDNPTTYAPLLEHCWWNVNLPKGDWTEECPDFLMGQVKKDVQIMSTKDEDHPRLSWREVISLIDSRRIDQFHRMPTDLRRYIKYCHDLKLQYGSILYFIQHLRLRWPTINPSGDRPFETAADYKILYNDWPYAIDQDIVHIVVWTKFTLPEDPQTGELIDENVAVVEAFIRNIFCTSLDGSSVVDRNDLRWFQNWRSLKSIHALEHFHVMIHKPPLGFIDRITNGDKPMCEQFVQ